MSTIYAITWTVLIILWTSGQEMVECDPYPDVTMINKYFVKDKSRISTTSHCQIYEPQLVTRHKAYTSNQQTQKHLVVSSPSKGNDVVTNLSPLQSLSLLRSLSSMQSLWIQAHFFGRFCINLCMAIVFIRTLVSSNFNACRHRREFSLQ